MAMRRFFVAATSVGLFLSSTAGYSEEAGVFIHDRGNHSCGKYLAAVYGHPPGTGKTIKHPQGQYFDEHVRYMDWLAGFLTAANLFGRDGGIDIRSDAAAIDVWMRKWCEQNPTKSVVEAAWAFVWDQRRALPEQSQQGRR
jgi:hypothetical protein